MSNYATPQLKLGAIQFNPLADIVPLRGTGDAGGRHFSIGMLPLRGIAVTTQNLPARSIKSKI
jgi:hypothetical protein